MKKQETALVSKLLSGDIKKPTALVHFQRNLLPLEQKIMTLIIFHCQTAKKDKRGFYYIRKKFVREFLGWQDSKNYSLIYEAFEGIYNNSIQWNFLEADRTFKSLKCRLIVSLLEPNESGSEIGFEIHPKLEPIIKDPKVFAKLKLIMMAILAKPKHAYALYELLADCYSRSQNDVQISLLTLKRYLGIPLDSYLVFKEFKKFVLKPNLEAINKHSDYLVTYKTYREGREVGGLIFHIKKQAWQPPLFAGAMQELQRYFETPALAAVEASTEPLPEEQNFITSVTAYHISEADARQAIAIHGLHGAIEIRDYALGEVERRKKTDQPIRNTGAYMAECLRKGHGKKTVQERDKAKEKQGEDSARKYKAELQQQLDRIKNAVGRARKEQFLKAQTALSPQEEQRFKEKFSAAINSGQYGEAIKNAFDLRGWQAVGIKPLFSTFLKSQILPPEVEDFRAEAVKYGQDYDTLLAAVD